MRIRANPWSFVSTLNLSPWACWTLETKAGVKIYVLRSPSGNAWGWHARPPASANPQHHAGASTGVLLSRAALMDQLKTNKPQTQADWYLNCNYQWDEWAQSQWETASLKHRGVDGSGDARAGETETHTHISELTGKPQERRPLEPNPASWNCLLRMRAWCQRRLCQYSQMQFTFKIYKVLSQE